MNKTPPWIASFVQECLSFYLDEGASKAIDVGDDGTDLSFKVDGSFAKANVLTVCLSCTNPKQGPLTYGIY